MARSYFARYWAKTGTLIGGVNRSQTSRFQSRADAQRRLTVAPSATPRSSRMPMRRSRQKRKPVEWRTPSMQAFHHQHSFRGALA